MALLKTAWANLQDGLGNRFSWSHVKAIFYNYAEHKLLSTKLDEMDALIDAKIAKAMMSSVQVNDKSKVPTSALAYSMSQEISQNEQNIATLNSKLATAVYASDLKGSFSNPTFVRWDGNTLNTPYKDGKTTASLGWAIVYGTDMPTMLAGAMGASVLWVRAVLPGSDSGWIQK